MRMHVRILRDLDLYLVVNQRQMKAIDVDYNIIVPNIGH
jgi:hypothetical protein